MRVGIIDAELLSKAQIRFPNLACMKMSAFHKSRGDTVEFLESYDAVSNFDMVLVSKVFSDTPFPDDVLNFYHVIPGGTGFFYDKYGDRLMLPDAQEHVMPDYSLYVPWATREAVSGRKENDLRYYTDYSIGFLTRGCFRRCSFCVNKNSRQAVLWSPPAEFIDTTRPGVCLLDDNFFACSSWESAFSDLEKIVRDNRLRFEFKQGLDIRLMDDARAEALSRTASLYSGDYIFAFDRWEYHKSVAAGLEVFRRYISNRGAKAYLLCAYLENPTDEDYVHDIEYIFRRLEILWEYACLGYLMRYDRCLSVPRKFKDIYTNLARWLNQPSFQKKLTFRVFCNKSSPRCAEKLSLFEKAYPEFSVLFDRAYPHGSSPYLDASYHDPWSSRVFNHEDPIVKKYWGDARKSCKGSVKTKTNKKAVPG